MKHRFLNALVLLVLLTTSSSFASNLNNFLVKVTENVTQQICFIDFDNQKLFDIYDNISKTLEDVPQIIYGNLDRLPKAAEKSGIIMRKCFLSFIEFDNYEFVSIVTYSLLELKVYTIGVKFLD